MDPTTTLGRFLFAIAMAFFAIQHFARVASWTSIPAGGPPWMFGSAPWTCAMAVLLAVAALCIATTIQGRCLAAALGAVLFLYVMILYVPKIKADMHAPGPWTSGGEILALCGASLVLAGTLPASRCNPSGRFASAFREWGRVFFALTLVVFGVQHFLYATFIATLITAWIPGHLFWAYFVGVAFIAAALSIATKIYGRLAATLLGTMFLLWVIVLHAPRVLHSPRNGNEWTSAAIALAMSGAAFSVAGALPRRSSSQKPADPVSILPVRPDLSGSPR
jgi:uncharacterized membrane protein